MTGNNNGNEIIIAGAVEISPTPEEFLAGIEARLNAIEWLWDRIFVEGRDYGPAYPGSKTIALYKPGAEKLLSLFGYSIVLEQTKAIEDFDSPLFAYTYTATVKNASGRVMAVADGACNSNEKKYLKYDNKADVQNMVIKIAGKRAFIGAVTMACMATQFLQRAKAKATTPPKAPPVPKAPPAPKARPVPKTTTAPIPAISQKPDRSDGPTVNHDRVVIWCRERHIDPLVMLEALRLSRFSDWQGSKRELMDKLYMLNIDIAVMDVATQLRKKATRLHENDSATVIPGPEGKKRRSKVAMILSRCGIKEDAIRHSITTRIFGASGLRGMTCGQLDAFSDWLDTYNQENNLEVPTAILARMSVIAQDDQHYKGLSDAIRELDPKAP